MHEAATAHEQSERIKYIIMLNYAYRLDKDMDQSWSWWFMNINNTPSNQIKLVQFIQFQQKLNNGKNVIARGPVFNLFADAG